jgi:hypothetical protein
VKYVWLLLILWGCPTTEAPPVVTIRHDTVWVKQHDTTFVYVAAIHDTVRLTRTIHDSIKVVIRDTVKAVIFDTVRVTVPVIVPISDADVAVRWDTLEVSAWGVTSSNCFQGWMADADPIDSVAYRRHMQSEDSTSWLCPRGRWMQGGEWVTSKSGRVCYWPLPAKRTEAPKRWYCGWVWK